MPATQTLQLGGERSPARHASGHNSGGNSGSNSGAYNTPNKELPNPVEYQEELNHEPLSPLPNAGHFRRPSASNRGGHPPIGPVMPDFDDLAPRRRASTQDAYEAEPIPTTMKRKTSVVKKLRDRVVRT